MSEGEGRGDPRDIAALGDKSGELDSQTHGEDCVFKLGEIDKLFRRTNGRKPPEGTTRPKPKHQELGEEDWVMNDR